MNRRPISVTIVAWALLFVGASMPTGAVLGFTVPQIRAAISMNPIPLPWQIASAALGTIVITVAGIALLKRRGWGRPLYAIWSLLAGGLSLATLQNPVMTVPSWACLGISLFFLYRPAANAYFAAANAQTDSAGDVPVLSEAPAPEGLARRILRLSLSIAGGFFAYGTGLLAFFRTDPPEAKFAAMGFCLVFASACIAIAATLQRRGRRCRDAGVSILCGGGATIIAMFGVFQASKMPEVMAQFPDNPLEMLSDTAFGAATVGALIASGLALLVFGLLRGRLAADRSGKESRR
ncbi:MAG: hypothetical protein AAB215_02040 [Planctomycetota bacterium]